MAAPALHVTPARPARHRLLALAALFVAVLALTAGLRAWHLARVEATAAVQQRAATALALDDLVGRFEAMQRRLYAQARRLAADPAVVAALRGRRLGDAAASEAIVHRFAALELPPRWAAELYDPDLDLVAWNGPSLPLDAAARQTRFLTTVQTAIARDGEWRQALVVWVPVRDAGGRPLGAVRLIEGILARTPVRNQYLRTYSLAEEWQRSIRLPVRLRLERPFPDSRPAAEQARLLHGLDGTILGMIVVDPPSIEQIVEAARQRHDDVLAFWTTLLLVTLVAALWRFYLASGVAGQAAGRLAAVVLAGWGSRYALLALDVPGRWQRGKAPLNPLFDPEHLASTFGGGLMRSTGDFFVSAVFFLLFSLALLHFATRYFVRPARPFRPASAGRFCAGLALTVGLVFGLLLLLAVVTRHAILDSTLDYFSREGLLPENLVLLVYCALLLTTLAVVLLIVGGVWMLVRLPDPDQWRRRVLAGAALVALVVPAAGLYAIPPVRTLVPVSMVFAFLVVGAGLAAAWMIRQPRAAGVLTLRGVLTSVFAASILLYPMFFSGLDAQRRLRMVDAADSFNQGRDPSVFFALRQMLDSARRDPAVEAALAGRARLDRDSLAAELLRSSLLSSLSAYDVSLVFVEPEGRPAGRYDASGQNLSRASLDELDADLFSILRQMYAEQDTVGVMVEQMTGRLESDRLQYAGVVPVGGEQGGPRGWVMARAEPHSLLHEGSTPFLRVLLPSGYSNLYANLSLAVFRDGVLIRSFGRDYGRYRLDPAVQRDLVTRAEAWHVETIKERPFLTYYRRAEAEAGEPVLAPVVQRVTAVRVPTITTFDHLYYLLRLTVAGLCIGLIFYALGLFLRIQAGLLPAPRVRFRDKVLNAFLVVGIIAVLAVGLLGVSVVTGENERAVQSWLRQHLERVEETLALDAQGLEMPYRVLDRVPLDSLATRVGLDLNLYQGAQLVGTSRQQLVRERLIDPRLPIQAYEALYLEGYQFTYVEEQLGTFTYTAGYRALLDEQGRPAFVVSVPTLPEQERIEEERARTLAYLFGALLLLIVVVMGTASLLANALSRPIGRLRVGLEDVARGRFERKLPVDTRDEVGELVETFNEMQEQLAESRRRLAQQERQLAWREMARQVAHEIKNPLTPMKLSVQHLRRAFDDEAPEARNGRFGGLFDRITGTLVEQIDTLARIANEFSSFARLPTRVVERLDLNEVIREAVALMQAEADAEIALELPADPLVIEADREELRRVYINLIKNAIQALPDAGGRVAVAARRDDAHAYSTVHDTGGGVPAELLDKIFEPNFSTKTSGTGLGLAIVRKSIEALDGEIGFDTEEGAGTTFWIRLPLAEA